MRRRMGSGLGHLRLLLLVHNIIRPTSITPSSPFFGEVVVPSAFDE